MQQNPFTSIVALVLLSSTTFAIDAGPSFEEVEGIVREKRPVQVLTRTLGEPEEVEDLGEGIKRYTFDVKSPGKYVPRRGRWIGMTIRVKNGRVESWDPFLIHSSMAGPSGRVLVTLPDINPLPRDSWRVADVLRDVSLPADIQQLGPDDRQYLVDFVIAWDNRAEEKTEDPVFTKDTEVVGMVIKLAKIKGKTLEESASSFKLSELARILRD